MLGVICQVCKLRPACVHITEQHVEQGHSTVENLAICHHCLCRLDIDIEEDMPPIATIRSGSQHAPAESSTGDDPSCPSCGLTLSQFRANKRFGCPHDYDAFADTLVPLFDEFHSASHHVGRTTEGSGEGHAQREVHKRMLFEKQLQSAIANEDYERAAELRDQIKDLGT